MECNRHARARGESAKAAAKTLADYTFKKAADERHMSPFAYSAQAHGHRYVGGKVCSRLSGMCGGKQICQ